MEDVVLSLFWICIMGFLGVSAACPDVCHCNQDYFIYCRSASLTDKQLPTIIKQLPSDARLLDLGSNNLENITSTLFVHLPKLEYLNLSDNRISSIEDNAFQHQSRLRDLNLNFNRLTTLRSGTFNGLSTVKELNLQTNYIRTIESKAFADLTMLQRLYLQRNKLKNITSHMFESLDNIHILDLSENSISMIGTGSFSHFKNLWSLRLHHNQLKEIRKDSFYGLSSVRELDLSHNRISDVSPLAIMPFRESINAIYLSHNLLTHISTGIISRIRRLETLDFSHNQLVSISRASFFGLSLLKLNLSSNSFKKINREMFSQARKIVNLDLSFNEISVFKTGALDSFRETVYFLNLCNNLLTEVNTGMFRGMKNLLSLNLDNNSINNIYDNSFKQLVKLEELRISHNQLTNVRASMLNGPEFQAVHLQENNLKKFSGFRFDSQEVPLVVHLNLSVAEQTETNVVVRWPYHNGSQIYWQVSVSCVMNCNAYKPRKDEYLPPYKTQTVVSRLVPDSQYYICVYPVIINKNVRVEQCMHVTTRPSRSRTTVTAKDSLSMPSDGSNGCISTNSVTLSWTFFVLLLSISVLS